MTEEERCKEAILEYTNSHSTFWPSDIAEKYGFEYPLIVKCCDELVEEGKLEEVTGAA